MVPTARKAKLSLDEFTPIQRWCDSTVVDSNVTIEFAVQLAGIYLVNPCDPSSKGTVGGFGDPEYG